MESIGGLSPLAKVSWKPMFLEAIQGAPHRMVSDAEAIGLIAGFLIAAGFIPQIIRVWKLRDAQEISLSFNLLNLSGTVLWLIYGLLQGLLSVIVWNGADTILVATLLAVKLKYGMRPKKLPLPPSSQGQ
jgi:MtN3 and saliva related transmembrane protein